MGKAMQMINGVMRTVDTGDTTMLRSPDGTRHFLGISNEGTLYTENGTVYNETLVIGAGGVTTGVPVSLPLSETYLGEELQIKYTPSGGSQGILSVGGDYQYVGDGVKTQVEFTFDLAENDELEFIKIV